MAHHPKDIISCEKGAEGHDLPKKDSSVYSGKGYVINEDDIVKAFETPEEESLPSAGPDVRNLCRMGLSTLLTSPIPSENP